MNRKHILTSLAVAAMVATSGCEDITNPVEELGELTSGWVGFEAPRAVTGPHGTWVPVRYGGIAVRPETDVDVTFEFGGTAVFGEDYVVVQDSGSTTAAGGFDATGGSVTFDYDPFQTASLDTLWVYIPTTATVGATAEINMTEATAATGDSVGAGYEGSFATFTVTVVRQAADIATGTYVGSVSGEDIGGGPFAVELEVTEPAGGITVGGTRYQYLLSDFSLGMFGVPLAMPFNVFVDGSMDFAGQEQGLYSCGGAPITATITGAEYDFTENSFGFAVDWTSCGIEGTNYTYSDLTLTE